jgi:hypothetical protein
MTSRKRQWANGTDQLLAGNRFIGVFGELVMPSAATMRRAADDLLAAGPHTRLGLTPRARKRLWVRDGRTPPVRNLPDAVATADVVDVLEHVRRRPGARSPLELHVSDRRLVVDFDHGLGDGRFAVDLVAALFALCRGERPSWADRPATNLALPRTLIRTFAADPRRARLALREASGMRTSASDVGAGPERIPWAPARAVSVAHVDAEAGAAVDAWRRTRQQRISSAAVWMHIARNAIRAELPNVSDDVLFAFDGRRYLKTGQAVNNNFSIALPLRVDPYAPVEVFSGRLDRIISSGLPLVGQAAVSGRALLRPRGPSEPSAVRPVSAPAELMYSDMGRLTPLDSLPWCDVDDRWAVGLLDPAGPQSITVLCTQIGANRRLTFSYHDNVFDRSLLDAAAKNVQCDPTQFLPGG